MKLFKSVIFVIVAIIITSCATSKDIVYFQDINERQLKALTNEYKAVIKKDDRLAIVVSGPDKLVTAPYNLTIGETPTNGDPLRVTLSYLVDPQGNIEFPILGTIHVEGMTRNQLVEYLTKEIGKDVKDPIVHVEFRDYKITVLGEVRRPGTYTFENEKVNILQALGMAGDLQLSAQRDGILLLREENGVQKHYNIDLRNSDILQSPYFYLQQNDVIVVPPSATRVASATTATGIWSVLLSSLTTLITVISFIIRVK